MAMIISKYIDLQCENIETIMYRTSKSLDYFFKKYKNYYSSFTEFGKVSLYITDDYQIYSALPMKSEQYEQLMENLKTSMFNETTVEDVKRMIKFFEGAKHEEY